MLADQMIGRIEYMHVKNFIHRDIKYALLAAIWTFLTL